MQHALETCSNPLNSLIIESKARIVKYHVLKQKRIIRTRLEFCMIIICICTVEYFNIIITSILHTVETIHVFLIINYI